MRNFLIGMLVVLLSQPASSQLSQPDRSRSAIKLLNPDGTPASEATLIVIKNRNTVVDHNLQVIPPFGVTASNGFSGEVFKPKAAEWNVSNSSDSDGQFQVPADSLGLLASSDTGFAFLPKPDKRKELSLRPWSSLKLITSNMPESQRDRFRLKVLWKNNFAGFYPHRNDFEEAPPTSLDWRYASYVEWTHILEVKDQTVRVPPGEATISLQEYVDGKPWSSEFRVGYVRVRSNEVSEFNLPEFGSVKGRWKTTDVLPDWNSPKAPFLIAAPPAAITTKIPEQLRVLLEGPQNVDNDPFGSGQHRVNLDDLAKYYASPEGTEYRYSSSLGSHPVQPNAEGIFQFQLLPIGRYRLQLLDQQKSRQRPCANVGQTKPIEFEVAAGKTSELGEVTETVQPAIESIGRDSIDPFGGAATSREQDGSYAAPFELAPSPPLDFSQPALPSERAIEHTLQIVDPKQAHSKILSALNVKLRHGINYNAIPLQQVTQMLSDEFEIPILIHTRILEEISITPDVSVTLESPPISLRSALNLVLSSVSSDLTFAVRDEVLLITTKRDAENNNADIGSIGLYSETRKAENSNKPSDLTQQIVQDWLKSYGKNADPEELRKQIQKQVEAEFDANQAGRRTEVKRLQDLLENTTQWLEKREADRKQIIEKRTSDLLKDL